jgi:phage-related protein
VSLPAVLKYAKHEIASIYPWLFTLDLTLTSGVTYYFVHNDEDIVFQGHTYVSFPFQIEFPEINAEGAIPSWRINIDNSARALEPYLQEYRGLTDSRLVLRVINAGYLTEDYVDLETEVEIQETEADWNWVSFVCGGRNLFQETFPAYRYLANYCRWILMGKFRAHECSYLDQTATVVMGTDGNDYVCYRDHVSAAENRPVSGTSYVWMRYWRRKDRQTAGGTGSAWQTGQSYTAGTAVCGGTLVECRAKGMSRRWGGFKGITDGGIRLV